MVEQAHAVVIGGGVGGTSIAYHLSELGWHDVVLVDRAGLTSGSTFHSAGLVGQLRSSTTLTRMMMYGAGLSRPLPAETGVDVSGHEVGSLRLASTPARLEELQRQVGWARTFGLPLELVSTRGGHDLFPLFAPAGVLGAVFLPTDGWLDPSNLAFALAAGAKARGARILTEHRVTGISVEGGRVRGVVTDRGEIRTDVVVNAGGMFAPEIGRLAGVTVPIIPMAHQYLLTKPIPGVRPDIPTMRDPDNLVYFREEVGGLCMGGYERDPAPRSLDGAAPDFHGRRGGGRSGRSGRWTSAASARSTAPRRTRWPGRSRRTPPTTTSTTPTRSGRLAGRCASRRAPWATRRCARTAGRASTGRRPSARRPWRRGRRPHSSTSRASPRSRSRGRAPSPSCSDCAPTTSTARSAPSPTRRCSTRAAASGATSPSRAWPRSSSSSSPGQPSATTTWAGSGPTCPRTAPSGCATSPRPAPASASGGRGRATSSRRSPGMTCRTRPSPT